MAIILNLETSTTNCSVSLGKDGEVIALKELADKGYSHSENLHVFIREVLALASVSLSDIDAIAVSKGPGSYTGLRIGVSSAKGLCFSLGKPLISVPTLEILAHKIQIKKGFILPLLDARRMEVYVAVFNHNYQQVRPTNAEIVTETSFEEFLIQDELYFLGSGAQKCKEVIKHKNAIFIEEAHQPSAKEMVKLSAHKFRQADFEDVAYFEPYYLKDFVTTKPSKG